MVALAFGGLATAPGALALVAPGPVESVFDPANSLYNAPNADGERQAVIDGLERAYGVTPGAVSYPNLASQFQPWADAVSGVNTSGLPASGSGGLADLGTGAAADTIAGEAGAAAEGAGILDVGAAGAAAGPIGLVGVTGAFLAVQFGPSLVSDLFGLGGNDVPTHGNIGFLTSPPQSQAFFVRKGQTPATTGNSYADHCGGYNSFGNGSNTAWAHVFNVPAPADEYIVGHLVNSGQFQCAQELDFMGNLATPTVEQPGTFSGSCQNNSVNVGGQVQYANGRVVGPPILFEATMGGTGACADAGGNGGWVDQVVLGKTVPAMRLGPVHAAPSSFSGAHAQAGVSAPSPTTVEPAVRPYLTDPSYKHLQGAIDTQIQTRPATGTDPRFFTIPAPLSHETYAAYVARLQALGYTGTATQSTLSDTFADPSRAAGEVVATDPAAGSQVQTSVAVQVKTNPDTSTTGSGIAGGGIDLSPLQGIPTPCSVFPFGVPCWIGSQLGALIAAPVAPHFTIGTPFAASLDVNLDHPFGADLSGVMAIVRPVLLFLSFLGLIVWLGGAALGGSMSGGGSAESEE